MPQRLLLWQIRILPTPKTSSTTYNCSNVKANDKPIKANSKPKTLQRKKRSGAIYCKATAPIKHPTVLERK